MVDPNELTTIEDKAKYVWETADMALEQEVDRAYIFATLHKKCHDFPTFTVDEITIGKRLGSGGFSNVYEITNIEVAAAAAAAVEVSQETTDHTTTSAHHYEITAAKQIMQQRVQRYGKSRYAIKKLRPDLDNDLNYARGAIDLAIEIKYMSVLVHPNIVKMRAVRASIPRVSLDAFIIMDRLYGTLEDKLDVEWYQRSQAIQQQRLGVTTCCGLRHRPPTGAQLDKQAYDADQFMKDRLLVAYDLTQAFQYMHDLKLCYRDIKPQNIGFDIRGDVKIFDFGLMKSMDPRFRILAKVRGPQPTYNLTGFTGSIPYMAPEVALKQPYNAKCDVFSFSMMLYEMVTLEYLYPDYSIDDYYTNVCVNNQRPSLTAENWNTTIPAIVKHVITEGWSVDPALRPDMKRIGTLLKGLLMDMVATLFSSAYHKDRNRYGSDTMEATGKVGRTDEMEAIQNRTEHMMNRSRGSTHLRLMKKKKKKQGDTSSGKRGGDTSAHPCTTQGTTISGDNSSAHPNNSSRNRAASDNNGNKQFEDFLADNKKQQENDIHKRIINGIERDDDQYNILMSADLNASAIGSGNNNNSSSRRNSDSSGRIANTNGNCRLFDQHKSATGSILSSKRGETIIHHMKTINAAIE